MTPAEGKKPDTPTKGGDGASPVRFKMAAQLPPPAPISGRSWIRSPEGPSKEQLEKDPIAGDFGLYFNLKIKKLKEQYQAGIDNDLITGEVSQPGKWASQLFKGVKIWVNGHCRPSHQELKRLMALHGGVFETYYTPNTGVTHIICTHLTDSKYADYRHGRGRPPVLKPEWITDSIAANKLLPMGPYEHVRIKHDPGQSVLGRTLVRLGGSDAPATRLLGAPPSAKPGPSPPALVSFGGDPRSERNVLLLEGPESASGGAKMESEKGDGVLDGANGEIVGKELGNSEAGERGKGPKGQSGGCFEDCIKERAGPEGGEILGRGASRAEMSGVEVGALNEMAARSGGTSPSEFASGKKRSRDASEMGGAGESNSEMSEGKPGEKRPRLTSEKIETRSEEATPGSDMAGSGKAGSGFAGSGITGSGFEGSAIAAQRDPAVGSSVETGDGEGGLDEQEMNTPGKPTVRLNESEPHQSEGGIETGKETRGVSESTGGTIKTDTSEKGGSRGGAPEGGVAEAGSSEASPVRGGPSRAVSHQSASPSGRALGYGVNKPGPNGYGSAPSGARSHCTKDDPDFINNYYKNSRLHFIGTWRSRYQAMGGGEQWRKGGGKPELPAEGSPAAEKDRLIVHIDMDCFFVNVVVRDRPELFGKAVAVSWGQGATGGGSGTAEISSANYKAREYGITASMFVREAKRRCPDLVIVNYDFAAYEEVADKLYSLLHQTSSKVQAVSCDEAFLDITGCPDPSALLSDLRTRIFTETGCTASAGIAHNLLLARMATRKAKPNGQHHIEFGHVAEYMAELPVGKLPGVGWSLEERLRVAGIHTCADVRRVSREALQRDFGVKTGDMLYSYARGVDIKELETNQKRKSVGAECNWGVRFSTDAEALTFLSNLVTEVCHRLAEAGVRGRQFTLKIKKRKPGAGEPAKFMGCGHCDNLSRSAAVPEATADVSIVERLIRPLYHALAVPPKEIRGVGIGVTRLEEDTGGSAKEGGISGWLERGGKEGGKKAKEGGESIGGSETRDELEKAPVGEGMGGTRGKIDDESARGALGGKSVGEGDMKEKRDAVVAVGSGALLLPEKSGLSEPGGINASTGARPQKDEVQASDGVIKRPAEPQNLAHDDEEIFHTLDPQRRQHLQEIKAGKARAEDTQNEPPPPQDTGSSLSLPPETELDPAVLAELPEEIRAELEQAYRQKFVGAGSTSRVQEIGAKGPGISGTEGVERNRKRGASETERDGFESNPSRSTVSKSVEPRQSSASIDKHERDSVEKGLVLLNNETALATSAASTELSVGHVAAAAPSDALVTVPAGGTVVGGLSGTGTSAGGSSPISALPPMSQVDQSVLDALPLMLRRELERAYETREGSRLPLGPKRKPGPVKLTGTVSRAQKQARITRPLPAPSRPALKPAPKLMSKPAPKPVYKPAPKPTSQSAPEPHSRPPVNAIVPALEPPPVAKSPSPVPDPPPLEAPVPSLSNLWSGDPPKWMRLCASGLDVLQPLMDVYVQHPDGEKLGLADALQGMAQGGVLPVLASQSSSPPQGSALLRLQCTPPPGGEMRAKIEALNEAPVEAYAAVVAQYVEGVLEGGLEEVQRLLKTLRRLADRWSFWGAIQQRAENSIQVKVQNMYGGRLRL
ncbi:DNA repair protein REV1 [Klebsormidium nitens]|uniref:DNA repair protein REV1 n=1 Tax=Klebsormidium nitens TaxID=105231 RepID=A0A1Y1I2M2_KLENI|nr:DNA repair protein REV1 [Klebsormidium nitens]|eukprot:GAQ82378.1 DNA repair protein REV1 [Klebsormidium nitens]